MSELVPGGAGTGPEVRVSDVDRQRVVERLRHHCVDGLLTLDEFGDRVGEALAAQRQGDLERLVRDLPVPAPSASLDTRRPRVTSRIVAFMGGSRRKGRWHVARNLTAVAVMGGCEIDLRHAHLDGDEVVIRAIAFWGGVDIIVPEGIPVEMDGVPIMGGKHLRVAAVPPLPGAPLVRVLAFPIMGGVTVRTKRERSRIRERHEERRERRHGAPNRQGLPAALGGTVTLLFTDIESFTTLCERLGDVAAQEVLRQHHALITSEVQACGGHVVKTQGDGAMAVFPGAVQGLRCAVQLQRALEGWNRLHPEAAFRTRMGLHAGEAVREGDDFQGRAVIVASRIASAAVGGEILVSGLLRELTASAGIFEFGDEREIELKGLTGTHRVSSVTW